MALLDSKRIIAKTVELHHKLRYVTTVREAVQILLPALTELAGFRTAMLKVRDEDGFFRGYMLSSDGSIDNCTEPGDIPAYEHYMSKAQRISNSYFASHEIHVWDSLPGSTGWEFTPENPDWKPGQWHPEDSLLVPIYDRDDRLVAVLWPDDPIDGEIPDERVVRIVELFADQVVGALEIRRLLELNQETSITDGLTRLYTHRSFQERLEEEIAEALHARGTVSLLMLDIDHFKHVNDTYGHPIGDEVLRQVAAAFRATAHAKDFPARYGGEEFAMILPRSSRDEAAARAEAIRQAVKNCQPSGGLQVTVSIGVATYPGDAHDRETLIATADSALFEAKHAGRDRVCLYAGYEKAANG